MKVKVRITKPLRRVSGAPIKNESKGSERTDVKEENREVADIRMKACHKVNKIRKKSAIVCGIQKRRKR